MHRPSPLVSLLSSDAASETLTLRSERKSTLDQPSSIATTEDIAALRFKPLPNRPSSIQDQTVRDATRKNSSPHEQQTLLCWGPGKIDAWPPEPAELSPSNLTKKLTLVWDIVLTTLPILPIILTVYSIQLDNEPLSEWGERVVAASRLGPTIFPILFTTLIGRLAKSLARYLAEKGTTVARLELLMGCQSVASTIGTLCGLRTSNLGLGVLAFSLWSLSPLGGQSALRLVSTTVSSVTTTDTLRYAFDRQESDMNDFQMNWWAGSLNIANAPYSASLLAPTAVKNSSMDLWGNVKIPMLEAPWGDTDQNPVIVAESNQTVYSSLLGVPVMGLQNDVNATFTLSIGYFVLRCSPMALYDLNTKTGLRNFLHPLQFRFMNKSTGVSDAPEYGAKSLAEAREIWLNSTTNTNLNDRHVYTQIYSWFLDTTTPLISNNISLLSNDTRLGKFGDNPDPAIRPFFPNITFAAPVSHGNWTMTNCTMDYIRVEANVSCIGRSCRTVSMRRLPLNDARSGILMVIALDPPNRPRYYLFHYMCYYFPRVGLTTEQSGTVSWPSATERYLDASENPFAWSTTKPFVNLFGSRSDVFSMRLSTLFNTYWQATLAPGDRTSSLSLDAANSYEADRQEHYASTDYLRKTLATNATLAKMQIVYKTEWTWLVLFLVASTVLQICAVAGLVLEHLCIGPHVLGYISTMTRDNKYTPLPSGASTLDGYERARILRDYRVQLADVNSNSSEGHVALCATGSGVQYTKLSKRRRYD